MRYLLFITIALINTTEAMKLVSFEEYLNAAETEQEVTVLQELEKKMREKLAFFERRQMEEEEIKREKAILRQQLKQNFKILYNIKTLIFCKTLNDNSPEPIDISHSLFVPYFILLTLDSSIKDPQLMRLTSTIGGVRNKFP